MILVHQSVASVGSGFAVMRRRLLQIDGHSWVNPGWMQITLRIKYSVDSGPVLTTGAGVSASRAFGFACRSPLQNTENV